ncbi:MAG: Ig-like domain-containing protein [Bacteroidetes bacterium]|nr:Ig-like domain-containing protein [Bacteroidota bacterium]
MKSQWLAVLCLLPFILVLNSCKKSADVITPGALHLAYTRIGNNYLSLDTPNTGLPVDSSIVISFNEKLDTSTVRTGIFLKNSSQSQLACNITFSNNFTSVRVSPKLPLEHASQYTLQLSSGLKGVQSEAFPGLIYSFTTINGKMRLEAISLNGINFMGPAVPYNIDFKTIIIQARFSEALDSSNYQSAFYLSGGHPLGFTLSGDHKSVTISNGTQLDDIKRYVFSISSNLTSRNGFLFDGFSNSFITKLDSTPKFPIIPDEDLLTLIQQKTFAYFYDFAHPSCGMARERNTSGDIVTTGGSGFGIIALLVGMHRNFITRDQGLTRLDKILTFLETCDRFHGAWPHWLNGSTGKVVPFTQQDDGGDLVETSYMAEGLYTMRQYLDSTNAGEKLLINRITTLVNGVEYDWYTRGQNVLYWHWSPDYGWAMNMQIRGYNETLITYIMAGASPTHPVSAAVYHQGYAQNGAIKNGNSFYGYILPLGEDYGGPLFFTHYSFLGIDPRNLKDEYANYLEQNVNQSMINYSYCVANPKHFIGYSSHCWGLTASDNPWGYNAQSPTNDLGVITPTAAVSALPYTPVESMNAIRHFYYILGDRLWGTYGFYDAVDMTTGWWANSYLAIDEGPIICMIENYRSQLPWNLCMSNPEVKASLTKLGFTY